MPLLTRTALLAVAALAAVGFAAVRITHAAEHRTIAVEPESPHREVAPAQAAATLAKLNTPPGFRQVRDCRFAERDSAQKCFWTPRALAIDVTAANRMAAFWRVRAGGIPGLDGCFAPHHWKGGMVLRHCNWELEVGPELVSVLSDSLLVPHGGARAHFARKALRYWRSGTEVRPRVIGRCTCCSGIPIFWASCFCVSPRAMRPSISALGTSSGERSARDLTLP
jgi:hypothetical protein